MTLFWLFLGIVILLVVGNALTLLRTARTPTIPGTRKPGPRADDEDA